MLLQLKSKLSFIRLMVPSHNKCPVRLRAESIPVRKVG